MTYNFKDTVYVRNINEKVSLNTLKRKLNEVFAPYGPVLSITAHKNIRMRGQAFVTLEDEAKASRAIDCLNDTVIFQKKIQCQLAKTSSDDSVGRHLGESEFTVYVEDRQKKKAQQDESLIKKSSTSKVVKVDLQNVPPNKILLIQELPNDITSEELTSVFESYKGFVQVRLVAVKRVAFIDFENEQDATVAKDENMDLTIREVKAQVSYAKK